MISLRLDFHLRRQLMLFVSLVLVIVLCNLKFSIQQETPNHPLTTTSIPIIPSSTTTSTTSTTSSPLTIPNIADGGTANVLFSRHGKEDSKPAISTILVTKNIDIVAISKSTSNINSNSFRDRNSYSRNLIEENKVENEYVNNGNTEGISSSSSSASSSSSTTSSTSNSVNLPIVIDSVDASTTPQKDRKKLKRGGREKKLRDPAGNSSLTGSSNRQKQSSSVAGGYDAPHEQRYVKFKWVLEPAVSPDHSIGFRETKTGYRCESVVCPSKLLKTAYFHVVIGIESKNVVPFSVMRVCEALQYCIPRENFRLILHSRREGSKVGSIYSFLRGLHIPYFSWSGVFSADMKMQESFNLINSTVKADRRRIIYHTDLDEIPNRDQFLAAIRLLEQDECDGIEGEWSERVSPTGSLSDVLLKADWPIEMQFPLQCKISANIVRGNMTSKTLVYRANMRVDGGQHQIWCSRNPPKEITKKNKSNMRYKLYQGKWTFNETCRRHILLRNKVQFEDFIMAHLPRLRSQPRICQAHVDINHYKFVSGLWQYLLRRFRTYYANRMTWWKDSREFLLHIQRHNNSVCVDCEGSHCEDTVTSKRIKSIKDKAF